MTTGEPDRALLDALRTHGGTSVVCSWLLAALPTIDGTTLTVFTASGRVVVASSGIAGEQAEDLQIVLEEGPCLDAVRDGRPVLADDLAGAAGRARWPGYAREAVAAGFSASFVFPVLLDGYVIAAMNLFRAAPGPLPADEHARTLIYATAAAMLLADDVGAGEPETGAWLDPGVARLQQAIGVVMVQAGVDASTALHRLRRHAFDHDRQVADVADDVLGRRLRFEAPA